MMNRLRWHSQGTWKLDKGEERSRTQTNQVERSRGRENTLLWQRKKGDGIPEMFRPRSN